MKTAMIVDDEPFILEMYRDILEGLDIQVVESAGDGMEAVDRYPLLDPYPSFILMDQRMPHMTGIEAARRILRMNPRARILFVSADNRVIDEALDAGAMGFLVKPFTIGALEKAISEILE